MGEGLRVEGLDGDDVCLLSYANRLAGDGTRDVRAVAVPIILTSFRKRVIALLGPALKLLVRRADAAVNHIGPRALARRVIVDVLLASLLAVRNGA